MSGVRVSRGRISRPAAGGWNNGKMEKRGDKGGGMRGNAGNWGGGMGENGCKWGDMEKNGTFSDLLQLEEAALSGERFPCFLASGTPPPRR